MINPSKKPTEKFYSIKPSNVAKTVIGAAVLGTLITQAPTLIKPLADRIKNEETTQFQDENNPSLSVEVRQKRSKDQTTIYVEDPSDKASPTVKFEDRNHDGVERFQVVNDLYTNPTISKFVRSYFNVDAINQLRDEARVAQDINTLGWKDVKVPSHEGLVRVIEDIPDGEWCLNLGDSITLHGFGDKVISGGFNHLDAMDQNEKDIVSQYFNLEKINQYMQTVRDTKK